jgi:hypothetical protein
MFNSADYWLYNTLVPLTDAVARVGMMSEEHKNKLIEYVKAFAGSDRACEACLTQFIEAAWRIDNG